MGTPLAELDYDEIFQTLSKDRQEEISEKRRNISFPGVKMLSVKAADIFYNSGAFSVKIDRIRIKAGVVCLGNRKRLKRADRTYKDLKQKQKAKIADGMFKRPVIITGSMAGCRKERTVKNCGADLPEGKGDSGKGFF